jgi:hypothetical protein
MAKYREGQVVMGSDGKTPYKMTGGQWVKLRETPEQPEAEPGFQLGEMAGNIIPSGKQYFGSLLNAALHPIETGKAVIGAPVGLLQKLPGAPEVMEPITKGLEYVGANSNFEPYADALIDFYVKRYGSVESALDTIEKDPVGALADASTVLGVTGFPKASAATNPVSIVKNTLKAAAKAATPRGLPGKMYESAAKFGTTIPAAERQAIVQTALKNRLNLTTTGLDKLQGLISGYNDDLSKLIQTAEQRGATIPKSSLYRYIAELKTRRGGVKVNAGADLQAIDDIIAKFDDHLSSLGKTDLTPSEVQAFKVDLYDQINWDARNLTGTPVKQETYKTLARGAKDELEGVSPEVSFVNEDLGKLYDLQPALSRSVARIENRNTIPLTAPIEVGAGAGVGSMLGGPVGGMVGGTAGGIAALLGIPQIKGMNAIQLQKLVDSGFAELLLKNNPGMSAASLAAALAERVKEEDRQGARQ